MFTLNKFSIYEVDDTINENFFSDHQDKKMNKFNIFNDEFDCCKHAMFSNEYEFKSNILFWENIKFEESFDEFINEVPLKINREKAQNTTDNTFFMKTDVCFHDESQRWESELSYNESSLVKFAKNTIQKKDSDNSLNQTNNMKKVIPEIINAFKDDLINASYNHRRASSKYLFMNPKWSRADDRKVFIDLTAILKTYNLDFDDVLYNIESNPILLQTVDELIKKHDWKRDRDHFIARIQKLCSHPEFSVRERKDLRKFSNIMLKKSKKIDFKELTNYFPGKTIEVVKRTYLRGFDDI